jgi:hypothetical protein
MIPQDHARTAGPAGIGFGVEAAVHGIGILGHALRTHLEGMHGGEFAVIGDVADDRIARAAVRAVYEGIAVSSIIVIL